MRIKIRKGALRALEQSALLAPSYAKPNWQLGNLLLRMGQLDQHSWNSESRHGATSTLPVIIVWPGDFRSTSPKVPRCSNRKAIRLASRSRFSFAKHIKVQRRLKQFLLNKGTSDPRAEVLLDELLKTRAFNDAYQVWRHARCAGYKFRQHILTADLRLAGHRTSRFWVQITPSVKNVEMSWTLANTRAADGVYL